MYQGRLDCCRFEEDRVESVNWNCNFLKLS